MAQVNTCLKRTFSIFNIFFAVVGAVIIALALLAQILTSVHGGANLDGRYSHLIVLYVVGGITMAIAMVGAYGAQKESRAAMVVFLVCMVIGSLLMLRAGIPTAALRPQLEGIFEEKFQQLLPLDKDSEDVKDVADVVQQQFQCCGLFSYNDWETNIPDSCMCDHDEELEGKCQTLDYSLLMTLKKTSVYIKPCFPIMMHYILLIADITIGVAFTLAILALLGMILSSIIIHQMRSRPTFVLTVPTIFSGLPPKYQELQNPPEY